MVNNPARRTDPWAAWPAWVLALYVSVAAALLLRMGIGWRGAARIVGASVPAGAPHAAFVRQSGALSAPVTVGVVTPVILLPASWRRWPPATLRAVLAHEAAHVRRRDLVTGLLARVNCCVFWFHPLAWWLERTLAAAAEEACDDEAIEACGDGAGYAGVLVDMARAVSRTRGRVVWPAAGIGGRLLRRRIDRALTAAARRRISLARAGALATASIAAILVAAACRPSPALPRDAEMARRDRALRATLEQLAERGWRDIEGADWDAGAAPLDALDAAVRANPDDLDALRRFLVAYWVQYAPTAGAVQNPLIANRVVDVRMLAARREHVLRLIARHPESELAGAPIARIYPADFPRFFPGDAEGSAQAKALWLAHTERVGVSAPVLAHAADFFESSDKPLAEQLLLRARSLEPDGTWTARLGRLYAIALGGHMVSAGRNAVRIVSAAEPPGAFREHVRRTLGETTDERLVTAAGWFLERVGSGREGVDFDPTFWAESCFRRALEINPQAILAHSLLLDVQTARRANPETLWRVPPDAVDARLASLPDVERFRQLPDKARSAFATLVDISRWDDPNLRDRRELAHEQSVRYAEQALALAPKFRGDPDYGTAIYTANMTLSAVALRDGDARSAVAHLARASDAPATEALIYGADVVWAWRRLLGDLVARGGRRAVIAFLDRMDRVNLADRLDLREAADELRRGEVPRALRSHTS